jgi:site-specific DNA-methyltransferase (adenine-specific)
MGSQTKIGIEINKLYVMDCLEFLKLVPDEFVDLIIIDPPYNMNKGEWDRFKSFEDFLKFTYSYLDALIPKLKNTGSFYIFNTPFNSAFILKYLLDKNLVFQNWITWDKRDGFSASKKKYVNAQETILFFTKSHKYVFNADDIRVPYESLERIEYAKKTGILKNGKRWFPNPKGKLCTDVWHFSSERHKNKINGKTPKLPHATPKPIDMIERMIKASSNPNDLVLDCFMGIGTTAVAAKKLGRNFIGCDINQKFIEIANQRLGTIEYGERIFK